MTARPPDVRIGISGFRYDAWRGVFYPRDLPHTQELRFASRAVRSIELNGSFYSLQRPSSYFAWHDEVPPRFLFAVKGPRFITHNQKLHGGETSLANFFASGVLALRETLGPILWQLPPQLGFHPDRLEEFFSLLPRTQAAAAELATRHNDRVRHGTWFDVTSSRRLRYALEVRHASFDDPAFIRLLRRARVALCVSDAQAPWPRLEDVTADFVYARLHGRTKLYTSGYSAASLERWAQRVATWSRGQDPADARLAVGPRTASHAPGPCDVYVYFDNDAKARAPRDAMKLAARVAALTGLGTDARGAALPAPHDEPSSSPRASAH